MVRVGQVSCVKDETFGVLLPICEGLDRQLFSLLGVPHSGDLRCPGGSLPFASRHDDFFTRIDEVDLGVVLLVLGHVLAGGFRVDDPHVYIGGVFQCGVDGCGSCGFRYCPHSAVVFVSVYW